MTALHWFRRRFQLNDRRRYRRYPDALVRVEIEGRWYGATDWSLGRLRIDQVVFDAPAGDSVAGTISPAVAAPGEFMAEVMYRSLRRAVDLRLMEIAPRALLAMPGLRAR